MKVEITNPDIFPLLEGSKIGYCSMVPSVSWPNADDGYVVWIEDSKIHCQEKDFRIIGEDDNKEAAERNRKEQLELTRLRLDMAQDIDNSPLVAIYKLNGQYEKFEIYTDCATTIVYPKTFKKEYMFKFLLEYCEEEKRPMAIIDCDGVRAKIQLKNTSQDGSADIQYWEPQINHFLRNVIALEML